MPDVPRPFWDHLEELRDRCFYVVFLFAITTGVCFYYSTAIIDHLATLTGGFVFTRLTEAFFAHLQIAAIGGAFLSIPFFLYEAWRFMASAFYPHEKKRWAWLLPCSYLLFCGGLLCSWMFILPTATQFLLGYSSPELKPMLSIGEFIEFAGWLALGLGLLFQFPLVILFLVRTGVVEIATLKSYRRHIAVGLAILAGTITPGPDPISQLIVFGVTYLLFEASLLMSRFL